MKKLLGLSLSMALLAMAVSPAFAQISPTSVTITPGQQSMTSNVAGLTYTFASHSADADSPATTTGALTVLDNSGADPANNLGHHVDAVASDIVCKTQAADGTPLDPIIEEAGCTTKVSTLDAAYTAGPTDKYALKTGVNAGDTLSVIFGACVVQDSSDTFSPGSPLGLTSADTNVANSASPCNSSVVYTLGDSVMSLEDGFNNGYKGSVTFTLSELAA